MNSSKASAPANPINNGEYMTKSTMLAIMGRMAAYTGKTITWENGYEFAGRPNSRQLRVEFHAGTSRGDAWNHRF